MKLESKLFAGRPISKHGVAAAMLVIIIMANSGAAIAHAMAKIPVIGAIAEVVTFREYESAQNNMEANIKIPEVSVKNEDGTVNEKTTQKINKSIQEYTDEIIAQYEADVEAAGEGEGHMDVELDYSVMYYLDSEIPEWDFQSIKEETTFYVNEDGKLTIVFDEYQVAPGYMGSVEFVIPTEAVEGLAQEGFLK